MSSALSRLLQALELLDRAEGLEGDHLPAALVQRLDDWLRYDQRIGLPDGSTWPEAGHLLAREEDRAWWFLPKGRLLEWRRSEAQPRVAALGDLDVDPAALAAFLRPLVLRWHLGGDLDSLEEEAIPAVVAEWVTAAFQASPASRAAILGMLGEGLRPGPGWEQAALRLRSAFERGLGDRSEAVRRVSAAALVRMATGQVPAGSSGDPARLVEVLLRLPRDDVRLTTLAQLLEAPPEALMAVAGRLGPLLTEVMALPQPEPRRLAGLLQMRLEGRSQALAIVEGLGSEDEALRIEAVQRLAREAEAHFDVLMPQLLEALEAPDPQLREASLKAIQSQIDAAGPALGRRILLQLLVNPDARAVRLAAATIERRLPEGAAALRGDAEFMEALRRALDGGPEEAQAALGAVWWPLHRDLDSGGQVEALRRLLQHKHPEVRRAVLQDLAAHPLATAALRDGLLKILVERLTEPEPALQLLAGRALLRQGYPHGDEMVAALAYDRRPEVRVGVVDLLRAEALPAAERAAAVARFADILLAVRVVDGDAEGESRWLHNLRSALTLASPRLPGLLLAALAELPAQAAGLFQAKAAEALVETLSRLTTEPDAWLGYCRRLMEGPHPAPEQAVRLAALRADSDARCLHFLWTCASAGSPEPSRAARLALLGLPSGRLDESVKGELRRLARTEATEDLRRLAARVLGQPIA